MNNNNNNNNNDNNNDNYFTTTITTTTTDYSIYLFNLSVINQMTRLCILITNKHCTNLTFTLIKHKVRINTCRTFHAAAPVHYRTPATLPTLHRTCVMIVVRYGTSMATVYIIIIVYYILLCVLFWFN